MRKNLLPIIFVAIFVFAARPGAGFDDDARKVVLDNGLTVLATPIPSSPVVSVFILIKTGSATEGKYLGSGITHFIEHMLFKGTHERGVGELAARIQSVGGSINASTGMDYTIYTAAVPREAFATALDVVADMVTNATIDEAEVERERNVIFSEMRLRNDNPDRKIGEWTFEQAYLRHPYRHPIIGYKSLLSRITRQDLLDYYRENYVPNNMILSVAGNIDPDEVIEQAEETFKDFERSYPVVRHLPQEPAQITPRYYEEEYPTDLTRLAMAYASVRLLDPDLYALDVLANILGQGKSSRLYLDIYKDKGLVYSISAYNYTPMDRGLFSVNGLLEYENVDAVQKAVQGHIEQIKAQGVTAQELDKAKQQARSEHVLRHKTSSSIAYAQALDEAFTGDHQFSKKYVDAVGRVTNEDIVRVANRYLDGSKLTTVVLKPQTQPGATPDRSEQTAETQIRKHVLDNGLTVLLKEDHAFPLVAVGLAANGGVRQETEDLNGIFAMLAGAWTRGTKHRSADQIAQLTEGKGIRFSGFSGRNSFGLTMEFLTEQMPTAMDLLEEAVKEPVFPEEEIEKVKQNMRTAIRRREDDIFDASAHHLRRTLFRTHPFRLEEEGTLESVDRITRDDILSCYAQYLAAQNAVLYVFGDIDPEAAIKEIEKRFGNLKSKPAAITEHSEEPPDQPRRELVTMNKQQAMVMIGFHGLPLDHEDIYGLDMLAAILGSSFNGRLFTNIREQMGDAYTLGGDAVPGPDAGFVYFYVLTAPEEADKVKELLETEITKVQTQPVGEQELNDMKSYLKGTFKASLETSSALGFLTGLEELYGLGYDRYRQYDERIERVTPEDLQRLAQRYLDLQKAAVVITKPER